MQRNPAFYSKYYLSGPVFTYCTGRWITRRKSFSTMEMPDCPICHTDIASLDEAACRCCATWAIICGFFRVQTLFGNIMVVIRLARGGAKKRPFFNIVATDSRNRRDGRFIERIGFYNPVASGAEESVRIVQDRLAYWQGVGAQLSPTVARLVAQAGKKAA
ncbi:small subunit ribosomal protein S16 [Janthinobacterium sp. Marseille]|nr:small subunit ribosomal protein S16 [Janthinobacterium sp. Marseille]